MSKNVSEHLHEIGCHILDKNAFKIDNPFGAYLRIWRSGVLASSVRKSGICPK